MRSSDRARKVLAPLLGLAVGGGIIWALGWWWLAVPAALVVTGTLWVMLAPEGAFDPRRRRRAAALDGLPPSFRDEIQAAGTRIAAVRALAYRFGTDPLRETLLEIAEHARAILDDVERAPQDYRRMRKALTHYLRHVETIAERLSYIARQDGTDGATNEEAMARSRTTLAELVPVFRHYRETSLEDETFDIDSRLTLLEQEIRGEIRGHNT